MNILGELVAAATEASPSQQEAALRLLLGKVPRLDPYLTLRDLSRDTGFGVTTLRRWQVPAHQIGRAKRYRLSEVEEYFKSDAFSRRQAAVRAERRSGQKATQQ